jgi:pimeloyl-ACP methyl ester carboxylesterase
MARQWEDIDALARKTGAHQVWGHSSGGLIALQAALTLPAIRKVAGFEPALSMYGTVDLSWIPGSSASWIRAGWPRRCHVQQGGGADRMVDLPPRWLMVLMINQYLRRDRRRTKPGEATHGESYSGEWRWPGGGYAATLTRIRQTPGDSNWALTMDPE